MTLKYAVMNEKNLFTIFPDGDISEGFTEITEEVYNNREKYIWSNGELILNPDFDTEQAQMRQAEFFAQFFEVPNAKGDKTGYFRKVPKGYNSAIESINTAFNAVAVLGSLPAGSMIFYEKPDFTKEEECTEDWLISNQFTNNKMTAAEFGTFYANFVGAWQNKEHLLNENTAG